MTLSVLLNSIVMLEVALIFSISSPFIVRLLNSERVYKLLTRKLNEVDFPIEFVSIEEFKFELSENCTC